MKSNGRIQLYPMLRVVAFLVVGIVAGDKSYGLLSAEIWFGCFTASVVAAVLVRKWCVAQTAMLFAALVFLGGCLTAHRLSCINIGLPEGETVYSAVVSSRPEMTEKTVRCDMIVVGGGRPFKVKASFYRDANAEQLKVGEGVRVTSVLEKPANYAGSTFDYARYLTYHGYSATTFVYSDCWHGAVVDLSSLSLVKRAELAALRYRDVLLARMRSFGAVGEGYSVLAAMTLGERVSMSDELNEDYSVSGAMHVLSLSGLHLGIIYAMLLLLFFKRSRMVTAQVLIICAIWVYVFIAGLPVSAVRSAVMLTVYSLISLLNRDKMSLNTLSVAAVALLVANPLNFYDVGFQMSFMSVMFIIILYQPLYLLLPQRARDVSAVRWVWQMTAVSVAAQVGVAPLVAYYFGRFSCYFLLANFVVVPASTVILYGAAALLLSSWLPVVQKALCLLLVRVAEWMNAAVSFIASLPGASIDGINMNLLQLTLVYVIIFSLYVLSFYVRKMLRISKVMGL